MTADNKTPINQYKDEYIEEQEKLISEQQVELDKLNMEIQKASFAADAKEKNVMIAAATNPNALPDFFDRQNEKITVKNSYTRAQRLLNLWLKENPDRVRKPQPFYSEVLASVLVKCFHFIRFSEDEGNRVAIYVDDPNSSLFGLYTQNYDYLRKVIYKVYARFDMKMLNETILKINLNPSIRSLDEEERLSYGKEYVAVGNGIFNLKTKQLEKYTPDKVFFSKKAINHNENATTPVVINKGTDKEWEVGKWLHDLAKDEDGVEDKQVYKLLWQEIGDSLNGNSGRNKAFLLYSPHGNGGKGSFQELLKNLTGTNSIANIRMDEFDKRFVIATANNKSLIVGDENGEDYIENIRTFLSIITGDSVPGEQKNRDRFNLRINATVVQSMNVLPRVKNKAGFKRRVIITPFRRRFTDDPTHEKGAKENKAIKTDYLARRDVLEYVMYKALNEYSNFEEFDIPDISRKMLEEYSEYNDPIEAFIKNEFIPLNLSAAPTNTVYGLYKTFCLNANVNPVSRFKFVRHAASVFADMPNDVSYKKDKKRTDQKMLDDAAAAKVRNIVDKDESTSTIGTISTEYYGNIGAINNCFIRPDVYNGMKTKTKKKKQ